LFYRKQIFLIHLTIFRVNEFDIWNYVRLLKWILLFISVSELSKYFKSVIKHYPINVSLTFFLTTSLTYCYYSLLFYFYFLYAKIGMLIINNLFNDITFRRFQCNVIYFEENLNLEICDRLSFIVANDIKIKFPTCN